MLNRVECVPAFCPGNFSITVSIELFEKSLTKLFVGSLAHFIWVNVVCDSAHSEESRPFFRVKSTISITVSSFKDFLDLLSINDIVVEPEVLFKAIFGILWHFDLILIK